MLLESLLLVALQDPVAAAEPVVVPWVDVGVQPTGWNGMLRDVSLCVAPDGALVSSCSRVGEQGAVVECCISRSANDGRTWSVATTLPRTSGASLFSHGDRLWLFGVEGPRPNRAPLTLRCSSDGGLTWTDPVDEHHGRLRGDTAFESRSGAVIVHEDRIYKLLAVSAATGVSAPRRHAFVASAALDSNWLEESSWRFSTELPLERVEVQFDLDDAVLVQPVPSRLLVVVRPLVRSNPASITALVTDDGRALVESPDDAAVRLPKDACGSSFTIDPVSWRSLALVAENDRGPSDTATIGWRNSLKLYSSQNVKHWQLRSTLLFDPAGAECLFSHAAWLPQADDLIAAVCITQRREVNSLRNWPSSTLVFLRVPQFRTRTEETPPLWEATVRK